MEITAHVSQCYSRRVELRPIAALPGYFLFRIRSRWSGAKNPSEEQKVFDAILSQEEIHQIQSLLDVVNGAGFQYSVVQYLMETDLISCSRFFNARSFLKPGRIDHAVILRMALKPTSPTYTFPALSTATEYGGWPLWRNHRFNVALCKVLP